MKCFVLGSLLFIILLSCSDEGIITEEPEITTQRKELIDSIYGDWILYGVGIYDNTTNNLSSSTIENATQSELCNFIFANIDGLSIGHEIKIKQNSNNTTIDKIYGCGESWIYNSAFLNINLLSGGTQARIEEYMNIKTLTNYHLSNLESLKDNKMIMWVEYDHRTTKKYILMYKKKNT